MVRGRPAIAAFWQAMMASGAVGMERETVDVEIDGDMVWKWDLDIWNDTPSPTT